MGLFEYHTRYLAVRLHTTLLLNISKINKLSLIAFTMAFSLASGGTIKGSPPWPSISINSQADNIISDDIDGPVFIVTKDGIYKYASDLKLLSNTSLTSSKLPSNETNYDLMNKILLIVKKNNQDLLFSCWQLRDLSVKCWFNKANELRFATHLLWSNESKGFKTDPNGHFRALESDTNELLIVTNRRKAVEVEVNSSQIPYLPAIGRFKIVKNPKHLSLEQKSVLPYKSRLNDYYLLYEYVYLFNYNHYTHFLLNDIQKPITTSPTNDGFYRVRLAKICNNDTDLTSYTEISLTCNNQNNIYAKFAYFDLTKIEPTLYVVFEALVDSSLIKKSGEKSSLCSYSMKLVDDIFDKAISDCHKGQGNLLAKLHPDSIQPPLCQKNPSNVNEWCTSKTNPYIDGSSYNYNVREDSYLNLNGIVSINFFHTTKQGPTNKTTDVLFIGTESGYLTKMSYDEDFYYTIDLNNNQVEDYQIGSEKSKLKSTFNETYGHKATKYSVTSRNIFAVTTEGVVNQLNIDACYYYSTCQGCLNTRDPLECVWCGDTCSRKLDCNPQNQSVLSCPPVIKKFFPKEGPISGWTKLRIEGENFGSSKGTLTVKLDKQNCIVDNKVSTSEVIECFTRPVDQPSNVSISVNVSDESSYIYSKGLVVASNPFVYVKVKVYGLYPPSGPQSIESMINVYGEYLDAGSNRSVLIGDSECKIIEYQANKISCMTRPQNNLNANESRTEIKHLKVIIDGQEQLLVHKLNFRNHNLSTSYMYDPLIPEGDSEITVDGLHDTDGSSYITFLIVAIIITILLLFLYLLRNDKFSQFKIKIPSAFESSGDEISNAKVSFRNPQSQKFTHSDSNVDSGSIHGLVKLNGSVMSSDYFGKPEQLEQDQPLMHNFLDNELLSLLVQEKILIDRSRLTLGHVLGSGQFGRVYKGFLKVEETGEHAAVAVKTLHNRSSWDDTLDNREFLEEGLMMKDFEHDNVLALIGVTFDASGLPMVITPFMLYGDLRSYISDEASSPTVKELIDFGTQVAKGMAYLSGLKFVHRDLAARNCMLDDNLTVKVADFGLSRDIYERDYYSSDNKKTKLPVKWMAIESLEKCIYNTKTDVWSYGILLWELMTRGVVPYPDVDNFDLFSYLKEGRRMLRPRYCPLILYKIMLSCWDENPGNRPTFDELVQKVSDVITQLKIAKDGQQKVSRDITYCDVLK